MHALGMLGAISVLLSEMPRLPAWPLAVLAVAHGHWLARREVRKPVCGFVWPGYGPLMRDGAVVEDMSLHWRGPLAFMRFGEPGGPVRRLSWWPDTLDARARRELHLAADRMAASRHTPRMAG